MGSESDSGYAIRVEGLLDAHWSQWLEGMTIALEEGGITRIEGPLMDQAALHGVLNKLRDLRLPIVTVQRLDALGRDAPIRRTTGKQRLTAAGHRVELSSRRGVHPWRDRNRKSTG